MPKAKNKVTEAPAVQEKPTPRLVDVMREVSNILAEYPDCISVERVHDESGWHYEWVVKKSAARKKIREMLKDLWTNSHDRFNYQDIAKRLRVDIVDIQAVLDEDFRLDNNLN